MEASIMALCGPLEIGPGKKKVERAEEKAAVMLAYMALLLASSGSKTLNVVREWLLQPLKSRRDLG